MTVEKRAKPAAPKTPAFTPALKPINPPVTPPAYVPFFQSVTPRWLSITHSTPAKTKPIAAKFLPMK